MHFTQGNPYTSWLLGKTMYMDFPFVKGIGDPYTSWGFCGGPRGDFHIHRMEKTHDVYGSPMTFTKKKSIYIVGVESHDVYGVFGDVYGSSNAFYEGGESIYIVVAM